MAKVIAVVQLKGGAGRSTVATNLAGELSKRGSVILVDADLPQGTAQSWFLLRQEAGRENGLTLSEAHNAEQLRATVTGALGRVDYVVIDGPPRIAGLTRDAVVMADLCLIPLGASISETWATDELEKTLKDAGREKAIDARILWTRFRGWTRAAQDLSAAMAKDFDLLHIGTRLGYRVAYADALSRGLTVCEWHDKAARDEFTQVVDEVLGLLG
ncbi:MAG: ParA family protein [Magnetococcales bacterium]|nr:ParA family protein [Magnetococcales bacterium]